MNQLPSGWVEAQLSDIADIVAGQSPASKVVNDSREGLPFFQGKAEFGDLHPTARKWTTEPARTARAGDILLSVRAPVGPTNLAPVDCSIGRGLMALQPLRGIHTRYLLWAIRATADELKGRATGSTFEAVTGPVVRAHRLPLAPAAEQARIVAAIEEAFSLLDAGETAMHNTRTRLKRMRDAVLTAAVTGHLVPQDPTDTPASRLLEELGVESVVTDADFLRVPDTWLWARVKNVGVVDLGRQRHPEWHTGPNMRPYLRVANVFEDRIDTSDVMEMHFEPEVFERFKVRVGDVLLNEGQSPELLGRPAIYRGDPPDVAFTNSILRFRAGPAVTPEWALLVFRAYMRTGRFTKESRITTNIAHLSAGRLKAIEFPVPPPEEQARILAEVQRQFSFIEATERAVDAGLARSAGLRRSVLKAAFEGRLVPQDPTDEPAAVLLERIAAERATAAPRTRRAPRRARGEAK